MKEKFPEALQGKKIPILTLDNKWYRLLDMETKSRVAEKEKQLNILLKRQGKLNTESKNIRKLKKKLMNENLATIESRLELEVNQMLSKVLDLSNMSDLSDLLSISKENMLNGALTLSPLM